MPQNQYTREEQYDMLAKLRKQVEFYFSPENLAQDTFLRSLLEKHGENGVPVETIATFHRVQALYEVAPWLPTLLSWAMASSLVVSVSEDGKWIRPISDCPITLVYPIPVLDSSVSGNTSPIPWHGGLDSKQSLSTAPTSPWSQTTISSFAGDPLHPIQMKERTTVIFHDVPDGCDFQEIMEVFTTDSVQPKSAYRDFGNTWHINFATEAQAVASVSATCDRKIRGQAIRAGIKSERNMAAPPKREGFTAQPTVRPLPQALEDLGISIPADETLRMPNLYKAPVQQLNVPQHAYYPMAPYSGYPPYNMNPYWPYGIPEMTQQYPFSNAMPPQYPHTYPQQAPPHPHSGPRHGRPGYVQHVTVPHNTRRFLKKTNKGVGEPGSKRNEREQATIRYVEQKAQSRDTVSPLTSHGSFEKERGKNKNNDRRHDSEPNAVNVYSQTHFPALGDNVATSRRTQSAPRVDYAAALLTSQKTSLPSNECTSQTQRLVQAVSKMNISTNAA